MISIALRNLLTEKARFAISVGGVAFSVMLILIILSLYQGWKIKSTEYIRNIKTDLWVTQDGSSDITSSASIIHAEIGEQIKVVEGVESIHKFVGRPIEFKIKEKDVSAYIVGFDVDDPIAGPQNMVRGTDKIEKGEIVVDRVLAESKGVEMGDMIEIFSKTFRIVGIADGANMFLFQFSFIRQEDAIELLGSGDFANFYLVKTQEGRVDSVKNEVNKIFGIDALTREEFVTKNKKIIDEVFLPIITVLVIISELVGTAVIGLTIYTATIEKTREFGVIKALGATNLQLYRIIFEQAVISGVFGFIFGVGLTYGVLELIPKVVPQFVTVTRGEDLLIIFGLALAMSLVASYTPVRRLAKIDPALVFKS